MMVPVDPDKVIVPVDDPKDIGESVAGESVPPTLVGLTVTLYTVGEAAVHEPLE
jgi:hypothetical protein